MSGVFSRFAGRKVNSPMFRNEGTVRRLDRYRILDLPNHLIPWILHLIGDVHQPLHVVQRFTKDNGDRGGNLVRLVGNSNLHSYWDSRLGSGERSVSGSTGHNYLASTSNT